MDTWSNTCWQWRHRWRLSQEESALETGVSLRTWGRWERGDTEPPAEEARRALALMLAFETKRGAEIVAEYAGAG